MTRIPVSSSNIKSVGYDPVKKTLQVEFQSGAVHSYADVPANLYSHLLAAPSVGHFFHANIRDRFPSAHVN